MPSATKTDISSEQSSTESVHDRRPFPKWARVERGSSSVREGSVGRLIMRGRAALCSIGSRGVQLGASKGASNVIKAPGVQRVRCVTHSLQEGTSSHVAGSVDNMAGPANLARWTSSLWGSLRLTNWW